jgi:dolichol-phosphate mannosyltransferase
VKLSIVIPAHNEAESLPPTVAALRTHLLQAGLAFDVLVVNDHSTDDTARMLEDLSRQYQEVSWTENPRSPGFGQAVLAGLETFTGDAVCIVMADASDDPADIVKYYRKLEEGYECVFGSRFVRGSRVVDYPPHKLVVNRLANWFIKVLFRLRLNDVTNAFKCYRREVIEGLMPILSKHFNLTVELPLKAIVRGYTYAVVPVNWYNRTTGVSKLNIKEMGSRYLFIVLYVWLERRLSGGDYHRRHRTTAGEAALPTPEPNEGD